MNKKIITSGVITLALGIAAMALAAADFTVTASPDRVTVLAGGAPAEVTVTVTSIDGFSSPVTLSFRSENPEITAQFLDSELTPPPDGSASTIALISASANAAPGTYLTEIVGTSGETIRTASVTVTVESPVSRPITVTTSDLELRFVSPFPGDEMVDLTTTADQVTQRDLTQSTITLRLANESSGATTFYPVLLLPGDLEKQGENRYVLTQRAQARTGVERFTVKVTFNPDDTMKLEMDLFDKNTLLDTLRDYSQTCTLINIDTDSGFDCYRMTKQDNGWTLQ